MHADLTEEIMRARGFGDESCAQLRKIMLKKHIKTDADCQLIEDVACLVFLEHYWAPFQSKHAQDEPKLVGILQKTWKKMSDNAHQVALSLPIPEENLRLIKIALGA